MVINRFQKKTRIEMAVKTVLLSPNNGNTWPIIRMLVTLQIFTGEGEKFHLKQENDTKLREN